MKNLKILLLALVVALVSAGTANAQQVNTTNSFGAESCLKSIQRKATAADTNSTSTVSESISAVCATAVSFTVTNTSGASNTHVVTLQGSTDNATWTNTATTLTGPGGNSITTIAYPFYRLKVTTAQGAASVSVLTLFAKNRP